MNNSNSFRFTVHISHLYNSMHYTSSLLNVPISTAALGKNEYCLCGMVCFLAYISILEAVL